MIMKKRSDYLTFIKNYSYLQAIACYLITATPSGRIDKLWYFCYEFQYNIMFLFNAEQFDDLAKL